MAEQETLGPGYHVLNHGKLGMYFALHLPEVNSYQALVLALHYGGPRNVFTGSELLHKLIVPALEALNPVFLAPVCKAPNWEHPDAAVAPPETCWSRCTSAHIRSSGARAST